MRRVNQPISVQVQDSRPARISWNDEVLQVEELIKCWVHQTGWWNPEGGERRIYYRLKVGGSVVDIYRSEEAWKIARVID